MVVAIHLMFVGVGPDASGGISVSRPLEQQPWFWAATWAGQIMPLFFVVGGFATATSLRSTRRRIPDAGLAARSFVHGRMQRLARPALPALLFLAIALTGATLLGVDPALVDSVATGVGSPLWFLGAYLICQLAAPALHGWHERAPRATLGVLFACVVTVDVLQFSLPWVPQDDSGMSFLGYLNLLFVWPLVQQLGFWYADGWFARRAWWQLLGIAALCWASLVPMTVWGPYSDNMLTNLNPPTLPLVALGLGQAALLQLLKAPLTALMRTRAARGVVYVVGTRLMTIYLWHLPLIVALAGLGLLVPALGPVPGSAAWWWSRLLVYLVVLGLLVLLSFAVGRFEHPLPVDRPASTGVLAVAGALTIVPTVAITMLGLDAVLAVVAALGYAVAVLLLRSGQNPKSPKSAEPKSAEPKSASADASAPASEAPVSEAAGS
ncbi:acyltransferase [Protaetiibacter intestinalis]|uniref:Acyltransferase n=2 Tax=Protaetiibacter intestinalis TaxID=2419774 RepID=A0A387BAY9_9MICO|nr:acyltransferase [Protaetiibacter intestinalis]